MLYNKKLFNLCFDHPKRYWYKNIAEIPRYFRLLRYLIKNGYNEYATWDTDVWFIDVMKPILTKYRDNLHGFPMIIGDSPNIQIFATDDEYDEYYTENEKLWSEIISQMVELLDLMDGCNPKYDGVEYEKDLQKQDKEMEEAKDEFFKLFSKYFYNLWD